MYRLIQGPSSGTWLLYMSKLVAVQAKNTAMSDGPFVHRFAYVSQRYISPRKSFGPLQSAPRIAWHPLNW